MSSQAGLGTLLRLLVTRLDEDVQRVYDSHDLPFRPRFYPLVERLREGPAGVSDLARAARVSQPAATQTLTELRKRGLVALDAGKDRRERLARLTPQGEKLAARLAPIWAAAARAAAALEPGLAEALARALAALDRQSFAARILKEIDG
jgi:DNA-binding MarR family transcriptional regulator